MPMHNENETVELLFDDSTRSTVYYGCRIMILADDRNGTKTRAQNKTVLSDMQNGYSVGTFAKQLAEIDWRRAHNEQF